MGKSILQFHSGLTLGKSRFVIAFLAAFVTGVFFGDIIHIDLWWLVGIAGGILLALILQWREQYWRLGFLILIGLIIGLAYFNYWDTRQKSIELSFNKEIEINGQIIGHPDFSGAQANYVLKYHGPQKTKIRLTTGRYPEYHYGDVLRFKATIKESYPYFFHQGILGQVYNSEKIEKIGYHGNIAIKTIYNLRDNFEESLNQTLTEPYASFAAGLVLGSKRNIPDSLMNDFNRTGTTHIVAVSGYNLTIVISAIALFLGIFSRKFKFWGTLLIIIVLVIMTGAPPSVVRAGILGGLVALGHHEGRRVNMTILLLLVAAIMLMFSPYALKYDISFQLSFLAFAGLVYFSSIIRNFWFVGYLPNFLKNSFSETLGAQIMVLPILVFYFGRLSLVSPIVNVLILWLIPMAMGLIYLMGILGLIYLGLGQAVGYIAWLILKYIIVVVEAFSRISWASSELRTQEWWWMVIFYAILIIIIFRLKKIKQRNVQKIQ